MPMIDVHIPDALLPAGADGALARDLANAVLRAEGVATPGAFHLDNTAAFVHRLPAEAVATAAAQSAPAVRVQIITPPGALNRDGQRTITTEATALVTAAVGRAVKTWVILSEAAEGGWGIDGTAYGIPEFTDLARRAAAATAG